MNLPPWMKLCSVCQCRYGLEPVCPLCQERAEWKRADRDGAVMTALIVLAVLVAWCFAVGYLIVRLSA